MNVFACKDVLCQIMLMVDVQDLRNLAQVNKLSATIPRSNYFWDNRFKLDYPGKEGKNINYRKVYRYKLVHTSARSEIYNVVFHHKEYKSDSECLSLQIKTRKKSAIYNYIAHLYNYEDFPQKNLILPSLVRGLREINKQRFKCDEYTISEFYDQYYNENYDTINISFYHSVTIPDYQQRELKNKVTYSTLSFYGTNNLSLAYFGEVYNNIVLKFFDFLYVHNFRHDCSDVSIALPHCRDSSPATPQPVAITPSLIKKVINHSKGCIVLNKVNVIKL